jgi:CDP-paratose 2-epimerase
MKTACFRGGCLTGPGHFGAMLHGVLSYLMKCAVSGTPYKCSATRANRCATTSIVSIWSVRSWAFFCRPRSGEVYNIGGGRHAYCSMLEAIAICEELAGRPMNWSYADENRTGDHIWWIATSGASNRITRHGD